MRFNWTAVLVAAIVNWLLGAVWFTVFANPWTAGLRMPPKDLQYYKLHPNFWPYLIAFVCSILLACVIATVVSSAESHSLIRGIAVGALIGVAVAVAMITEFVFEVRPRSFILIAAGYPFAGSILMGIIIGAWRPRGRAELDRTGVAQ
jgi:Protein of unknown function (DUF1761)